MERRKLTKEDIDKVRNIEGFPIGSDEDIIALSDAPFIRLARIRSLRILLRSMVLRMMKQRMIIIGSRLLLM